MTRHPLDMFSLISGLLFVTLGALFMLDQSDQINLNPRWVPAIVVFVLGFGGIVSNGRKALRPARPPVDNDDLRAGSPIAELSPESH